MPSRNRFIVAAAGGGKTTRIVEEALRSDTMPTALVTYTQNNVREIRKKIYERHGSIKQHVEVWSWFSFLLRELARPYQREVHDRRIDGIFWVEGRSAHYVKQTEVSKFYFSDNRLIYSDKLSKFVCKCNMSSQGAVMRRLEQRFGALYIDEIQDMAGYDVDLIELMLRSRVNLTLVGDHRQATFRTNNAARNSSTVGTHIVEKFKEWQDANLGTLSYSQESYRCHQSIVDLADKLFPNEPKTISRNEEITGHDGVFAIEPGAVHEYVKRFRPQVLRLDKRTPCHGYDAMNFGESKGLTFDRVLIFPHKKGQDWLKSGDIGHIANSAARLYVGITRARFSVTFVTEHKLGLKGVQMFS